MHLEKFAFIIHPLAAKDLLKHKIFCNLKIKNRIVLFLIEWIAGFFGGIKYGTIKNIQSQATGEIIQGEIYTLLNTPWNMSTKKTKDMYHKILKLTKMAQQDGAKIIGLGAYTKIIGDAGVTLSKLSPIPLTTGNSLSAAATLWAANLAVSKMGFVPKENNRYLGTVMVIGATGSIGKVIAQLLAPHWNEVILTSRSKMRIDKIRDEIATNNPTTLISVCSHPDERSSECDLIITATSAKGASILDIQLVKSGCVICDVSRPFDISKKEAFSRPDVLVIASGEVLLPGNPQVLCDLNLPNNAVYACLAETALLALEHRFESFTVGREINYEKVKEIDLIARKHGVKLATIMGHDLEITQEEIDLCREHAIKNRTQH